MRMKWKPDKAPGHKREQKQRLERQQKRKAFAKNMERADALAKKYYDATDPADVCPGDLEEGFVYWAFCNYLYKKSNAPMTQLHKRMHETWCEIVASAAVCAKATEARTYPKRRAQQKRAAAAFRERKRQQRMQRDAR
jgi:hypothetical protein